MNALSLETPIPDRTRALRAILALAVLCLIAFCGTAAAQHTITTQFAENNSQSGNMFDIVAQREIRVVGFDLNLSPGNWDVEVWTVTGGGSFVGLEQQPTAWTLISSYSGVVSAGTDNPTSLPTDLDVTVPESATQGFYITCSNGTGIRYTSVATFGAIAADNGDLQVLDGRGVSYPFGGTFSPRRWNGTVHYYRTMDVPAEIPTIQTAISTVLEGDAIRVVGTHSESNIDFLGRAVTVKGAPGAIVDCGSAGRGFLFQNGEGNDSVLESLIIRHGLAPAASPGGGILIANASPTLRNCLILNCATRDGIAGSAGFPPFGGSAGLAGGNGGGIAIIGGNPVMFEVTVDGCITGNGGPGGAGISGALGGDGGRGGHGAGIYIENGSPTLVQCIASDNATGIGGVGGLSSTGVGQGGRGGSGGGIYLDSGSPFLLGCRANDNQTGFGGAGGPVGVGGDGGGVAIAGGTPVLAAAVLVYNSLGAGGSGGGLAVNGALGLSLDGLTIADNQAGDAGAGIPAGVGGGALLGAGQSIANSILWSNMPDQVAGGPTVEYCNVSGGHAGAGNFDALPSFVSTWTRNYRLNEYSVCVGAGSRAHSQFSRDLDGEPRVIGPEVDVGADEVICGGMRGSNEDFDLESWAVGGSDDPLACAKFVSQGAVLAVRMVSPGGTFDGEPPLLLGQAFPTNGPALPDYTAFPNVHLPDGLVLFNGLAPSPLGETVLQPGGLTLHWQVLPFLVGLTVRLQAFVFAGHSANHIFAISDAHDLVFE